MQPGRVSRLGPPQPPPRYRFAPPPPCPAPRLRTLALSASTLASSERSIAVARAPTPPLALPRPLRSSRGEAVAEAEAEADAERGTEAEAEAEVELEAAASVPAAARGWPSPGTCKGGMCAVSSESPLLLSRGVSLPSCAPREVTRCVHAARDVTVDVAVGVMVGDTASCSECDGPVSRWVSWWISPTCASPLARCTMASPSLCEAW